MQVVARLRQAVASKLEMAAEVLGLVISVSGATVAAVLGKLIIGAVLAGVAIGFVLRLKSRRTGSLGRAAQVPAWVRPSAAALSVVEVALLVEAVNLPIPFSQEGFQYGHWYVVALAFFALYLLQSSVLVGMARRAGAQGAA